MYTWFLWCGRGHATAIGWQNTVGAKATFFDPNKGHFSWALGTPTATIAEEILANLDGLYELDTIRNFVVYALS